MADDLLTMKIDVDSRDFFEAQKAAKKFERNLLEIENAYREGSIHAGRYNAEILKQTKALSKLGGGYKKAQEDVHAYMKTLRAASDDQIRYNRGLAASGKGLRNMELFAQQAGYQIGDFAVQVQSGTNIAVAFGQQMSQLLGFLGPKGALAGAGIAIATGIIAPFLKANKEIEELKKKLTELNDFIENLGKPTTLVGQKSVELAALESKLREQQAKVGELRGSITAESEDGFVNPLAKRDVAARERYAADIEAAIEKQNELVEATKAEIRQLEIKETQKRVYLALQNSEVLEAEGLQQNAERQTRENNEAARQNHEEEMSRLDQMDEAVRQFYSNQIKQENELAKKREAANKKLREQADKVFQLNSKRMQQEIALNRVKINYGQNEETLIMGMEELRLRNLNILMDEANLQDGQRDTLRQQLLQLMAQEAQLRKINKEEKERLERLEKMSEKMAGKGVGYMALSEELALRAATGMGYVDPNKNKDKDKKKNRDLVKDMLEEVRHKTKLLTLNEQEQRAAEIMFELKQSDVNLSDKRIQALIQESEALYKATQAEEARTQQIETISNQMESAFMSMVDGSKSVGDAFKNLVRQMLIDSLQQKVVSPFVSAIMGGFKADGGPVQAGRTYMVGERGPELFTAPTNGNIIPNHDLGGGKVTVNQTINVSTGVQQTVRTEIKSLMPQIAEASKAAVADAKRRGGSYGRNFA